MHLYPSVIQGEETIARCEQGTGAGQGRVDKGLGVLEWTGKLIPQGLLVKGALCRPPACIAVHASRSLAWEGQCITVTIHSYPGASAGVKTGWRTAWELMMKELAPQSSDGDYTRPSYGYIHSIGEPGFPVGCDEAGCQWLPVHAFQGAMCSKKRASYIMCRQRLADMCSMLGTPAHGATELF